MTVELENRVLFLPDDASEGIRVLEACPNRPFRPFAVILWGARADTFVRQLHIGRETQFVSPMSGYEFEADCSYSEFRSLCVDRADRLMPAIERMYEVGMFHRLWLPAVEVGDRVELTVEGPIEHAVILGDVPRVRDAAGETAA